MVKTFEKDAFGSSQYERNITHGFFPGSPSLIDIRLVLTKEQMLCTDIDPVMPPKYFALCADNNRIYYYDKSVSYEKEKLGDETRIGKFTALDLGINDIVDDDGHSLIKFNEETGRYEAKIPFVPTSTKQLENNGDGKSDKFVTVSVAEKDVDIFKLFDKRVRKLTKHDLKDLKDVAFTNDFDSLDNKHFEAENTIYKDVTSFYSHLSNNSAQHGNHREMPVSEALTALAQAYRGDNDLMNIYVNGVKGVKITDNPDFGTSGHRVGDVEVNISADDLPGLDSFAKKEDIKPLVDEVIAQGLSYNNLLDKPSFVGLEEDVLIEGNIDFNELVANSPVFVDVTTKAEEVLQTKQNKLVAGSNIILHDEGDHTIISALGGGEESVEEVFVATPGVTTYNQIEEALTKYKIVLAIAGPVEYAYVAKVGNTHLFSRVLDKVYFATVDADSNWLYDSKDIVSSLEDAYEFTRKYAQPKMTFSDKFIYHNSELDVIIPTIDVEEPLEKTDKIRLKTNSNVLTTNGVLDIKVGNQTLKKDAAGLSVNIDGDTIKLGPTGLYAVPGSVKTVKPIVNSASGIGLKYKTGHFRVTDNDELAIANVVKGIEFGAGFKVDSVIDDGYGNKTIRVSNPGSTSYSAGSGINFNSINQIEANYSNLKGTAPLTVQPQSNYYAVGLSTSDDFKVEDNKLKLAKTYQEPLTSDASLRLTDSQIGVNVGDGLEVTDNLHVKIDGQSLITSEGVIKVKSPIYRSNDDLYSDAAQQSKLNPTTTAENVSYNNTNTKETLDSLSTLVQGVESTVNDHTSTLTAQAADITILKTNVQDIYSKLPSEEAKELIFQEASLTSDDPQVGAIRILQETSDDKIIRKFGVRVKKGNGLSISPGENSLQLQVVGTNGVVASTQNNVLTLETLLDGKTMTYVPSTLSESRVIALNLDGKSLVFDEASQRVVVNLGDGLKVVNDKVALDLDYICAHIKANSDGTLTKI